MVAEHANLRRACLRRVQWVLSGCDDIPIPWCQPFRLLAPWKKRYLMSVHRTHSESNGQIRTRPVAVATATAVDALTQPDQIASLPAPQATPQTLPPVQVPHTRAGTAWAALIGAALLAVLLIIFLVQNTRSTEVSFLWMTASTPLAVALLIAAVGAVLLTLILGTARIAQLRRLVRKQRHR